MTSMFAPPATVHDVEEGELFTPKFGPDGLIPAIVTDASSGEMLMFAWMDAAALNATLTTGEAHFYSRSRAKPWKKGEESGNTLAVREVTTDCDQDVVHVKAIVQGAGVACHTKRRSCFYRVVVSGGDGVWRLRFT